MYTHKNKNVYLFLHRPYIEIIEGRIKQTMIQANNDTTSGPDYAYIHLLLLK